MSKTLEGDEGVRVTLRPLFTPGKDSVPFVQEAGWAPGSVWTGTENLAPPSGFDPRTVQPVANRYTDWATGHTNFKNTELYALIWRYMEENLVFCPNWMAKPRYKQTRDYLTNKCIAVKSKKFNSCPEWNWMVLRSVIPVVLVHYQRILSITGTVKHNNISLSSTVRIQLHVSALYVGHLQVVIYYTYSRTQPYLTQ